MGDMGDGAILANSKDNKEGGWNDDVVSLVKKLNNDHIFLLIFNCLKSKCRSNSSQYGGRCDVVSSSLKRVLFGIKGEEF